MKEKSRKEKEERRKREGEERRKKVEERERWKEEEAEPEEGGKERRRIENVSNVLLGALVLERMLERILHTEEEEEEDQDTGWDVWDYPDSKTDEWIMGMLELQEEERLGQEYKEHKTLRVEVWPGESGYFILF